MFLLTLMLKYQAKRHVALHRFISGTRLKSRVPSVLRDGFKC